MCVLRFDSAQHLFQSWKIAADSDKDRLCQQFMVGKGIKEECIWHHNFKSLKEAKGVITEWVGFYNTKRKHSALQYKVPAEVFWLVA
jgi:hypothetical protein